MFQKKRKRKKPILSNWVEPEGLTQPPSARRWPGRGPRGAQFFKMPNFLSVYIMVFTLIKLIFIIKADVKA
jgi:hypothetical protein